MRRKNGRIWSNLLDSRCPMCGEMLRDIPTGLECSAVCEFFVTQKKADVIITEIRAKEKTIGVKGIAPNGKLRFKSVKVWKGERPKQIINLGF